MGALSEFVRGFCIIGVSGGLIMLTAPNGRLKKYVKFIISLCMVCSLLSAFFTFSENADGLLSKIETATGEEAYKTKEELYRQIVKESKKNMESEICSLLSAHTGMAREDIYTVAKLDASEYSSVEITEIYVFLADMSYAESAQEYLEDMFMKTVEIIIRQKGE